MRFLGFTGLAMAACVPDGRVIVDADDKSGPRDGGPATVEVPNDAGTADSGTFVDASVERDGTARRPTPIAICGARPVRASTCAR